MEESWKMNVDNWSEPFFALREKEGGRGGDLRTIVCLFLGQQTDGLSPGIFF